MKLSIIVELEYPEDCVGPLHSAYVEKAVERSLKPFLDREGLTLTHLEAAQGNLHETFNIEQYESQKAALTERLEASLRSKA